MRTLVLPRVTVHRPIECSPQPPLSLGRSSRLWSLSRNMKGRSTPAFNHAAQQQSIQIDRCLAPGIVVAELRGLRPAKGVTENAHATHVQPPGELAGGVCCIELLQAINHKPNVRIHAASSLLPRRSKSSAGKELRVILWKSRDHPAIRERNHEGAIRGVDPYDDVAVTRQVLGQRRVIPNLKRRPSSKMITTGYRGSCGARDRRPTGYAREPATDPASVNSPTTPDCVPQRCESAAGRVRRSAWLPSTHLPDTRSTPEPRAWPQAPDSTGLASDRRPNRKPGGQPRTVPWALAAPATCCAPTAGPQSGARRRAYPTQQPRRAILQVV